MLAGMRSFFLVSFLLAFCVAIGLPLQAQINGVPASVTSFGFGGSTNPNPGVRASVTSLGPNGYSNRPVFGNCCFNLFMPANPNPPLFFRHHHRGVHDRDRNFFPVGVSAPGFVPYAVPYAVPYGFPYAEEGDAADAEDDSADADYVRAPVQRNQRPVAKRALDRESAAKAGAYAKQAVADPEEPASQPATALIFKDGRKSDVLNYAIVGDTLFDFDGGRTRKILLADLDLAGTRKANEERGVDFQVPASAKAQ